MLVFCVFFYFILINCVVKGVRNRVAFTLIICILMFCLGVLTPTCYCQVEGQVDKSANSDVMFKHI